MARPTLFVIGDSISMQYGPYLQKMTAGHFAYARKTGKEEPIGHLGETVARANGGDSSAVRLWLETMCAAEWRVDLLLLNCGLHDIRTTVSTGAKQVPLAQYRKNLQAIVRLLKDRGIDFIWVRTTQVDDDTHNNWPTVGDIRRYDRDQQRYNAVADEIMSAAGVAMADLDGFTRGLGSPAEVFIDHVHFVEPVRKRQAAFLAGFVQAYWQRR